MQQPSKPPKVLRKSRKRRRDDEKPVDSAGAAKRIPLTLQISGAVAVGMLLMLILAGLISVLGGSPMLSAVMTPVATLALFGLVCSLLIFGIAGFELWRSRCPECGKHGTFARTGESEYRAGESGLYRTFRCTNCGHKESKFERSWEGGDEMLGPERYRNPFS